MREIKFRGKTEKGEWVYGLLAKDKNGTYISNAAGRPHAFLVLPETVGQYTGLKDSKGAEIYEGDVVKMGEFWDNQIDVVIYKTGMFMLKHKPFDYNDCTIIGNVHDNPELFKTEQ